MVIVSLRQEDSLGSSEYSGAVVSIDNTKTHNYLLGSLIFITG
jgi:hypothetical protein